MSMDHGEKTTVEQFKHFGSYPRLVPCFFLHPLSLLLCDTLVSLLLSFALSACLSVSVAVALCSPLVVVGFLLLVQPTVFRLASPRQFSPRPFFFFSSLFPLVSLSGCRFVSRLASRNGRAALARLSRTCSCAPGHADARLWPQRLACPCPRRTRHARGRGGYACAGGRRQRSEQ